MKIKKLLAGLTAVAMAATMAGCGGSGTSQTTDAATTDAAVSDGADTASNDNKGDGPASLTDLYGDETIELTVYSQLANYSGKQTGWFAEVMKREFNVDLIIVPDTDGMFDTRMESGNLGDIVIFGSNGSDYQRAAKEGMLFDWNEDDILSDYGPYIKEICPTLWKTMLSLTNPLAQAMLYTVSVTTLLHLPRITRHSSIQWTFAGIFTRSSAIPR